MHSTLVEMQPRLSSHTDEHRHRVELRKHSLEAGEEGSLLMSTSSSCCSHKHANTLHLIPGAGGDAPVSDPSTQSEELEV